MCCDLCSLITTLRIIFTCASFFSSDFRRSAFIWLNSIVPTLLMCPLAHRFLHLCHKTAGWLRHHRRRQCSLQLFRRPQSCLYLPLRLRLLYYLLIPRPAPIYAILTFLSCHPADHLSLPDHSQHLIYTPVSSVGWLFYMSHTLAARRGPLGSTSRMHERYPHHSQCH
ncbi:hypothetical protein BOTBODRAFT_479758 [Botryobasidium botryosum FD-172 SS1]|uniref:Uncharacterized protein n=1 Tax=Botryobasidium botryosum (strain FD-172 SS1) TaxID=930990 RepID=A0A067MT83_BOTB1|nr:hypothetical protein BOTBODRAFT_479758 [Botryobasidium botryosum FD-172 SS1]